MSNIHRLYMNNDHSFLFQNMTDLFGVLEKGLSYVASCWIEMIKRDCMWVRSNVTTFAPKWSNLQIKARGSHIKLLKAKGWNRRTERPMFEAKINSAQFFQLQQTPVKPCVKVFFLHLGYIDVYLPGLSLSFRRLVC